MCYRGNRLSSQVCIYLLKHIRSPSTYCVTQMHVDRATLRRYYKHTKSKVTNRETKRAKKTQIHTQRNVTDDNTCLCLNAPNNETQGCHWLWGSEVKSVVMARAEALTSNYPPADPWLTLGHYTHSLSHTHAHTPECVHSHGKTHTHCAGPLTLPQNCHKVSTFITAIKVIQTTTLGNRSLKRCFLGTDGCKLGWNNCTQDLLNNKNGHRFQDYWIFVPSV